MGKGRSAGAMGSLQAGQGTDNQRAVYRPLNRISARTLFPRRLHTRLLPCSYHPKHITKLIWNNLGSS